MLIAIDHVEVVRVAVLVLRHKLCNTRFCARFLLHQVSFAYRSLIMVLLRALLSKGVSFSLKVLRLLVYERGGLAFKTMFMMTYKRGSLPFKTLGDLGALRGELISFVLALIEDLLVSQLFFLVNSFTFSLKGNHHLLSFVIQLLPHLILHVLVLLVHGDVLLVHFHSSSFEFGVGALLIYGLFAEQVSRLSQFRLFHS